VTRPERRVVAAIAVLVLVAVAAMGYIFLVPHASPSGNGGTGECGYSSTCQYVNSQGLRLELAVNATVLKPADVVAVTLSEAENGSSPEIEMPSARAWGVQGLSLGGCPPATPLPFGIAIFRGYFTQANVSSASRIPIFYVLACPTTTQTTTTAASYSFPQGTVMSSITDVHVNNSTLIPTTTGQCSSNGTPATCLTPVASLESTAPGVYTLVGGDEWGNLVFLHFTVVAP
jgi:hypothetical protein